MYDAQDSADYVYTNAPKHERREQRAAPHPSLRTLDIVLLAHNGPVKHHLRQIYEHLLAAAKHRGNEGDFTYAAALAIASRNDTESVGRTRLRSLVRMGLATTSGIESQRRFVLTLYAVGEMAEPAAKRHAQVNADAAHRKRAARYEPKSQPLNLRCEKTLAPQQVTPTVRVVLESSGKNLPNIRHANGPKPETQTMSTGANKAQKLVKDLATKFSIGAKPERQRHVGDKIALANQDKPKPTGIDELDFMARANRMVAEGHYEHVKASTPSAPPTPTLRPMHTEPDFLEVPQCAWVPPKDDYDLADYAWLDRELRALPHLESLNVFFTARLKYRRWHLRAAMAALLGRPPGRVDDVVRTLISATVCMQTGDWQDRRGQARHLQNGWPASYYAFVGLNRA